MPTETPAQRPALWPQATPSPVSGTGVAAALFDETPKAGVGQTRTFTHSEAAALSSLNHTNPAGAGFV